jgi:phosphoglycerate dehydrogenase-like enzyme
MPKIVVTQNLQFTSSQKERLNKLGEVTFYDDVNNDPAEWLKRVSGFEIIISESFGLLQNLYKLKNCFVSIPFVALGKIDSDRLKKNKVIIANAPGCNKEAVCEWIIFMLLSLIRKIGYLTNSVSPTENFLEFSSGLKNSQVVILGKGNVGSQVGAVCNSLGMQVSYYLKDDNLIDRVKEADVIINCLSRNESTEGLLNKLFFKSLKKGSYYITTSRPEIHDTEAMLDALADGTLAGVADDCSSGKVGDATDEYYKKIINHKGVLATPHIAWNTKSANDLGNDLAIDNIEAYLRGKPINLIF